LEAQKFGQTPKNTPKFTEKLQSIPFHKHFLNLLKKVQPAVLSKKIVFFFGMAGGPDNQ
jgi:hypothetical protein